MGLNQGYAYRETLGPEAARLTLLEYLAQSYRHSSEDEWQTRIDEGLVLVDGQPAGRDDRLHRGQTLVWHRPPWEEPAAPLDFAVLYEDEHVLAVAKPAGLPTLPGGGFLNHTLLALVRRYRPTATPLHRLGRGTSGVMLWAKTSLARRRLIDAWRNGVGRTYRTLVQGAVGPREINLETPIGVVPHALLGSVFAATPQGKPSLSRVRLLEHRKDTSLVEVDLVTGRPHQIRIHLAAAGHPLVGDPLYTAGGLPKEATRALPGDLGYLLHAERMRFPHPETGRPVDVICLPPPSLRHSMTV